MTSLTDTQLQTADAFPLFGELAGTSYIRSKVLSVASCLRELTHQNPDVPFDPYACARVFGIQIRDADLRPGALTTVATMKSCSGSAKGEIGLSAATVGVKSEATAAALEASAKSTIEFSAGGNTWAMDFGATAGAGASASLKLAGGVDPASGSPTGGVGLKIGAPLYVGFSFDLKIVRFSE